MKNQFYSTTFNELQAQCDVMGFKPRVASQLYNWHFKKKMKTPLDVGISVEARELLKANYSFTSIKLVQVQESSDKTVKFLFELSSGETVESVLIPFHQKYSLCVSSQVGCAMKCSFCYTGVQGYKRNLETYEIVNQYLEAWRWLNKNRPGETRILNIVFMGQGEPLHNFDNVRKACEIFTSQHGASVGSQKITVSTSGYLPGLERWKEEMPQVNLALSLHSTFKEKRDELIPINKKYPLKEVLSSIDQIHLQKKQFVTYEYLLVKDFNDSQEDAEALGKLLQGKPAYINLIPFNPFPGSKYQRPSDKRVLDFKEHLDRYKIPTLLRTTKGDDILGACGQLNTKN